MEEQLTPRDFSSSPQALTPAAVHTWLLSQGAQEIITGPALAAVLGISKRTVANATKEGKLKRIAKNTYLLKDCIPWMLSNPRFVAQHAAKWEITEETPGKVRAIILNTRRYMLKYRDIDDLTSEVLMLLQRKRKTGITETSAILYTLARIYRTMKRRGEIEGGARVIKNFTDLENKTYSFLDV